MLSEIDDHIGRTLGNIELVDHLINSPIEPFAAFADFSSYNAPLFTTVINTVQLLSEFLLCAEASGFTLNEAKGKLEYRVDACDHDNVLLEFLQTWDNRVITFWAFVKNCVLLDYHMARVLGDQA